MFGCSMALEEIYKFVGLNHSSGIIGINNESYDSVFLCADIFQLIQASLATH